MLTTSDTKSSGATQLLKSEEDLTLNEKLWFSEPIQKVNKLLELTFPVLGDQTIQDNHSTECSGAATFPSQVLLALNDQRHLVRHVPYVNQNGN